MTFEEFMQKTLDVFPDALVHEDTDGNIIIEPGFYEVPGQTELGTYKPSTDEDTEPEGLTPEEEAELADLEAEFEEAGGRGVELAERIDALRRKRDGE